MMHHCLIKQEGSDSGFNLRQRWPPSGGLTGASIAQVPVRITLPGLGTPAAIHFYSWVYKAQSDIAR